MRKALLHLLPDLFSLSTFLFSDGSMRVSSKHLLHGHISGTIFMILSHHLNFHDPLLLPVLGSFWVAFHFSSFLAIFLPNYKDFSVLSVAGICCFIRWPSQDRQIRFIPAWKRCKCHQGELWDLPVLQDIPGTAAIILEEIYIMGVRNSSLVDRRGAQIVIFFVFLFFGSDYWMVSPPASPSVPGSRMSIQQWANN